MRITANFPFRELRSDSQMWSKPIDPKYLNSVLMNVKLDRLEWNGTLWSKGKVSEIDDEEQKEKDSSEKMEIEDTSNQKSVILYKMDEKMEVEEKSDPKSLVPVNVDAKWLMQIKASQESTKHDPGEKMEV